MVVVKLGVRRALLLHYYLLALLSSSLAQVSVSFQGLTIPAAIRMRSSTIPSMAVRSDHVGLSRRELVQCSLPFAILCQAWCSRQPPALAQPAASTLDRLRGELQQARKQMDSIPDLIKAEKWDSVRAVLITPPLSDLWTKSARKQALLQAYADAVGDNPSGDELAVLEAKEDAQSHLRYLDMAVYNNVFNPIKTEGETGASKGLIKSYKEDPINEYSASVKAIDELIQLGKLN